MSNDRMPGILVGSMVLVAFTAGCYDRMFPPVVCNGYSQPIRINCVFIGGKVVSAQLPAGASMSQREKGLVLQALTVTTAAGAVLADYSAADLQQTGRSGEERLFWLVSPRGLSVMAKEEFRSWMTALNKGPSKNHAK